MENSASRPFDDYLEEQMKDPAFRAEWDALEPEFALIRQLLDLRLKEGLSQRGLAERAGVPQSTIARIESGQPAKTTTLFRIASALNVKVGFIPNDAHAKRKPGMVSPRKRHSPGVSKSR